MWPCDWILANGVNMKRAYMKEFVKENKKNDGGEEKEGEDEGSRWKEKERKRVGNTSVLPWPSAHLFLKTEVMRLEAAVLDSGNGSQVLR